MATNLAIKRMTRERVILEKENDDYMVLFKDDNLLKFEAYVLGPSETLYSHKFIKLQFEIPSDYPLTPPKCKFIQHSGGRIHPNLYTDGKVCLSILGTWEGEKWAFAMTCETVLITIRSLLDNKPYTHEPGQEDNEDYNNYVQYSTWRWLLLDYLHNETEPKFKLFLQRYIAKHGDEMIAEVEQQAIRNSNVRQFTSQYRPQNVLVSYPNLKKQLREAVKESKKAVAAAEGPKEEMNPVAEVEGGGAQVDTIDLTSTN